MNDLQQRIALAEQQVVQRKLEISRCYAEVQTSIGKRLAHARTLIFVLACGWTLRLLTRKRKLAAGARAPSLISRTLGLLGSLFIMIFQFLRQETAVALTLFRPEIASGLNRIRAGGHREGPAIYRHIQLPRPAS
jgi:hypothetical protein